jgi:hypothetical protein
MRLGVKQGKLLDAMAADLHKYKECRLEAAVEIVCSVATKLGGLVEMVAMWHEHIDRASKEGRTSTTLRHIMAILQFGVKANEERRDERDRRLDNASEEQLRADEEAIDEEIKRLVETEAVRLLIEGTEGDPEARKIVARVAEKQFGVTVKNG